MKAFLAQDNSCHWYIIEADKRAEWEAWNNLDEDDVAAWDAPDFAQSVGGDPSLVVFEIEASSGGGSDYG